MTRSHWDEAGGSKRMELPQTERLLRRRVGWGKEATFQNLQVVHLEHRMCSRGRGIGQRPALEGPSVPANVGFVPGVLLKCVLCFCSRGASHLSWQVGLVKMQTVGPPPELPIHQVWSGHR